MSEQHSPHGDTHDPHHPHEHHEHHDHEHEYGPLAELVTLRDWLRHAVSQFNRHQIFCGHGVDNPVDEALWLILGHLGLPHEQLELFLDAGLMADERESLHALIERRCHERQPTAYLLGEAWLGDYRFQVDENVIVPRSYFAELLASDLDGWLDTGTEVKRALDLCTGSGCLAILMAEHFPEAAIDAVDLSPAALAVASRNLADYGLEERIRLVHSDLFEGLGEQSYDFILSNPPYVTSTAMAQLPAEYRHEPQLALAAGEDGMDVVRRIIAAAPAHLNEGGLLAVEVGHNRAEVEAAFPELPLHWLSAADGVAPVFVIRRADLSGH